MMRTMILAVALLTSVGCKSEIDGKAAAVVSDAPATVAAVAATATQEVAAESRSVAFDLAKSKIEWTAAKVTKDHQGGFKSFTGTVTYGPDGSVTGIETEIDAASVFTEPEKLTNHLKAPDFLDVAKFPTSSFKSSKIEKAGANYNVTGVLDLHGVQKEISFPASITTDGTNTVATAEFTLKRFDFGIEYKGAADDLINPEVLMRLTVVAPRPPQS